MTKKQFIKDELFQLELDHYPELKIELEHASEILSKKELKQLIKDIQDFGVESYLASKGKMI